MHPIAAQTRTPSVAKPKLPSVVSLRMGYLESELDILHGQMETIRGRLKAAQNTMALDPDDEAVVEIVRNLTAKRMEAVGRIDGLRKLHNEANEWLPRALRLGPVTDQRPRGRIPHDEADLLHSIGTLRSEINRAKVDLMDVKRASTAPVNLEGQVRTFVATLAAKGRPPQASVAPDGTVNLDFTSWDSPISAYALMAWMDPQALTKRLVAEITERQAQTGRQVMTASERAERIAELTAKLDAAERREVLLVETAIDRGIAFTFRPDTAIDAFLGVKAARQPEKRKAS